MEKSLHTTYHGKFVLHFPLNECFFGCGSSVTCDCMHNDIAIAILMSV